MKWPLALLCLLVSPITWANPLTLKQVFEKSLTYQEAVPLKEEQIRETRAQIAGITAKVLPHITAHASEELQDNDVNSTFGSEIVRFSTPEANLKITQPLFHGLSEFHALKAAKYTLKAQDAQLTRAKLLLFNDVAQAYLNALDAKLTVDATQKLLTTSRATDAEMDNWFKIGKVRESDVVAHKAQTALLAAQLETYKGIKDTSYEVLSFLDGVSPHPDPTSENMVFPILSQSDSEILNYINNTPEVVAQKQQVAAAKKTVTAKKGYLLPQADVEGNYYAYRTGLSKNVDWDVTFRMEMPVFNLENYAAIKQAKSQKKQQDLILANTIKQSESTLKQKLALYKSSIKQKNTMATAGNLAKQAYDLKKQDLNLGQISTVDFLSSEKNYFETYLNKKDTLVNYLRSKIELVLAMGVLP
ncbi:TolC family protein [bacterium]|nr:TolC family protein [bacterium]